MNERHKEIHWNGFLITSDLLLIIHQSWNCVMNRLVFFLFLSKMPGGCPFMAPLPPWGAGICYCGALPEADLLVGQQAILGAVGHLVVLLVVPAVLLAAG